MAARAPTPGASDAWRAGDGDCAAGARCADGRCTRACAPDACAMGLECVGVLLDEAGTPICRPREEPADPASSRGCACRAAPPTRGGGAAALGIAIAFGARRRRVR
ncbi:MAG: hypothetical protein KF729_26810 [Sandaracinaceae bacterium]|nr:hypothetical protein [Sandaracinaceae bacterium]